MNNNRPKSNKGFAITQKDMLLQNVDYEDESVSAVTSKTATARDDAAQKIVMT